jgi:single-strand DNA-binding protein
LVLAVPTHIFPPATAGGAVSRSLNKAILIGNLGSDPEIRTTGGGTKVAEFSLATGRRWTDKSGQQQEKTEWHRIIAWSALADVAERFLKKGEKVYIEGEIQYRSWEDKDGNTRYTTEINARELMMLGGREGGSAPSDRGASQPARSRQPASAGKQETKKEPTYDDFSTDFPGEDDDLPF